MVSSCSPTGTPGLPLLRTSIQAGQMRRGVHRPFEFPIRLSYGHERWELNERGVMRRRAASINDVARAESDRQGFWPAPSPRLADHPGIPDVESPGCLIRFTRPFRGNHP
jgi:hypothetical protein